MKKWKFSWTCCEHVFTCRHADGGSDSPAIAEGEVEAHTIADAAYMVCDILGIDFVGHWDADILEIVSYPEAKLDGVDVRIEISFDDHDIVGYVRYGDCDCPHKDDRQHAPCGAQQEFK